MFLFITAAVVGLADVQRAEATPRLVVDTSKSTFFVKPDGQLDRGEPSGEQVLWSPDRKHKVVFRFDERRGYVFTVADAAGKTLSKLSEETDYWPPDQIPSWSPDGKRLAFGTRSPQIAVLDLATGKINTVTREERGAYDPQFLPDGRLAYRARREDQTAKSHFSDIVVSDGTKSEAVVKHVVIHGFAFSPDGTKVAYDDTHHGGTLTVLDLKSGKTMKLAVEKNIGQKLHAHGGRDIRWRPDGKAIAVRFTFLGGRLSTNGEAFELPGDREVFLLPLEGQPIHWRTPLGEPRLMYWRE
jgi:dipeptidyl aminopeptidase/acylaminoacyl peptidase